MAQIIIAGFAAFVMFFRNTFRRIFHFSKKELPQKDEVQQIEKNEKTAE
ncbi:MAG TPA: hypothetical protein VII99_05260 [Bacteroidia bacterium]